MDRRCSAGGGPCVTAGWLEEVRSLVGPRGVVTRTSAIAYESDGLTMERGEGAAVVLPRGTAETARVMRVLARHGVPIVPVVFHGGHNGLFILHDGERLAQALRMDRVLRSDTWPLWVGLPWGVALGPWFHVPLPVKCVTEFLDPIPTAQYGPESAEDPEVLQVLYDQVQGVMQDRLEALADEFPGMF